MRALDHSHHHLPILIHGSRRFCHTYISVSKFSAAVARQKESREAGRQGVLRTAAWSFLFLLTGDPSNRNGDVDPTRQPCTYEEAVGVTVCFDAEAEEVEEGVESQKHGTEHLVSFLCFRSVGM